MPKKIVLAGGTGFTGKYFEKQFVDAGYEVIIISRRPGHVQWNNAEAIKHALENSEMLINLAGKSVDCRYTAKNKYEILKSRTETTTLLGEIIFKCDVPPPLWINSSTATIYRHAEDHAMTENNGEMGSGFSVEVAKTWEKSFFSFQFPQTRQVALRMAIVLGKDGGVIIPFRNLVKLGLGGIQGNGKQMFSWIHIEDLYNIILFIQSRKELHGVFNCCSPNPIDNKTLMQAFRKVMHRKFGLPSPKFLLSIGAAIIGTETELVLKSRWVVPEKLLAEGFVFKHPQIENALRDILQ